MRLEPQGSFMPSQSRVQNRNPRIALPFLLLTLCMAGCGQVQLYSNLEEREANEMMALLTKNGIDCTKQAGEENTWTLMVSPDDFGRSVETLKNLGYPKDEFKGIGEQFQKSGLVSSPTEEHIRYMHALAQELSATISRIDGVVTARVHIVLPNNDPFAEEVKPSSASVFIKARPDAVLDDKISEIKRLVVSSIEGLKYDNVTTVLVTAEDPPPQEAASKTWVEVLSVKLAPESVSRFWTIVGSCAAVGILGLAAAAVAFLRPRFLSRAA